MHPTTARSPAQAWAEKTGNSVQVVSTPNSATEKLSLYQQLLGSQSSDIDVMLIDIVWPGMLNDHLVDLSEHLPSDATGGLLPRAGRQQTPSTADWWPCPGSPTQGFSTTVRTCSRKHGHEVPRDLAAADRDPPREIQAAEREAGNDDFWGFQLPGAALTRGLTCNALEWVASHGGGTIVDETGEVTIDNPRAAAALDLAASWIGTISPRGCAQPYRGRDPAEYSSPGNALFLRNWPYVWSLANGEGSEVQGKIGMAPLPHGAEGESKATLGGWNLAVSRYSEHPALAADLVAFITSREQQKAHAIQMGMNPTIEALYEDEEVLASNPSMSELYETLTNGVPRPATVTGDAYARVTNAFFNRTHQVLSGELDGASAVQQLGRELERLGRRGW